MTSKIFSSSYGFSFLYNLSHFDLLFEQISAVKKQLEIFNDFNDRAVLYFYDN